MGLERKIDGHSQKINVGNENTAVAVYEQQTNEKLKVTVDIGDVELGSVYI